MSPKSCLIVSFIPAAGHMQSLTGYLSLRCGACAVPLLRVHLPGVGAAPPRSNHGAPGPRQCIDRAEQHQQPVPGGK